MRGRRWIALVVAAGVLVSADLGVRASSGHLPEELVWGNWEAQFKAELMDEIAGSGKRGSFVFVGSSMVDVAFDPSRMDLPSREGEVPFNAALFATDARTMDLWTRHVVFPRLRPRTVVIGVQSFELNDRGLTQRVTYENIVDSREVRALLGRESVGDRLARPFSRLSALVKHRNVIRRPDLIAAGKEVLEPLRLTPYGIPRRFAEPDHRTYKVTGAFREVARDASYNGFKVGGAQLSALDRSVRFLRERGVEVILVKMPVTQDAVDLHPRGADDYALFEQVLEGFVERHRLPFIEVETAPTAGHGFYDPVHLNTPGRRYISSAVATTLTAIGSSDPHPLETGGGVPSPEGTSVAATSITSEAASAGPTDVADVTGPNESEGPVAADTPHVVVPAPGPEDVSGPDVVPVEDAPTAGPPGPGLR